MSDEIWVWCSECYLCEQGDCENSDRYDGCYFGIRKEEEDER
jgi:hypothetical protein